MVQIVSFRRLSYNDHTLTGISYRGRIICRDSILERIFGAPDEGSGKSEREWAIVLDDGILEHRLVIYDWNEDRDTMSRHRWRVESHSSEAMKLLVDLIRRWDNCAVSQ